MVFKMKITLTRRGSVFKGLQEDGIYTNPLYFFLSFLASLHCFCFCLTEFGIRFRQFPALAAYVIDLAGALTAIILFSVFSALSSSPFLVSGYCDCDNWYIRCSETFNQIPALLLFDHHPVYPAYDVDEKHMSPYSKLTVTKQWILIWGGL